MRWIYYGGCILRTNGKGQKIISTFASTTYTSPAELTNSKFRKLGFSISNVKKKALNNKKRHTDA